MPESEEPTKTTEMPRVENCSLYCFFFLPLLFSISCLVASAFVVVDRGDYERAPDMVYSGFPKKEFHTVTEVLPCPDIDEYDAFITQNSGGNRQHINVPRPDENEDQSDADSDQIGDYFHEKSLDRGHNGVNKPSQLHNANVGHHKVQGKLRNLESPGEEEKKLEREIERIAEGDETSRRRVHRKRNGPKHCKQKKLELLDDHEFELDESQETGNWKSKIPDIDGEFIERDPKIRENVHRKRSGPRPSYKQNPQISGSEAGGSDASSRRRRPMKRKKRHRVLGQRHLSADNEPLPNLSKRDAEIDVDDWGYCGDAGPEKWQEKWPDCGGNAQSPINLDTTVAKIDYEPILKWKGYSNTPSKMTLINNGHSVVLTTSYEDCGNRPYIWDSIMNHEYVFGELTFHWGADESSGSEHTLNFMKFPLEMQVIHYRRELGSIEKAQEVPGGVAIVGILFHIDAGKHQNQGIADIQTGFSKVRDGPSSTTIQPFPLTRLIPQFSKHYLSYNGSMTTPPCAETVIWIIHLKQATISTKQLAKFHRLKNEGIDIKQNNRPVQKANKRCVLEIT